jgi:hypothetical protein
MIYYSANLFTCGFGLRYQFKRYVTLQFYDSYYARAATLSADKVTYCVGIAFIYIPAVDRQSRRKWPFFPHYQHFNWDLPVFWPDDLVL